MIDFSKYLIDPNKEYPGADPLLFEKDDNRLVVFQRSNISLIRGQAKSRKSTVAALLLGLSTSDIDHEQFHVKRASKKLKGLYIDSEMSKHDSKSLLLKMISITGEEESIKVLNLKECSYKERIQVLKEYIKTYGDGLDLIVIDGIRDFCSSINNETESTELSTMLLKLSSRYDLHIVSILHENYNSDKARGHIGSELVNKAQIVIATSVNPKNKMQTLVSIKESRNKSCTDFIVEFDENNCPTSSFAGSFSAKKQQKAPTEEELYFFVKKIFKEGTLLSYSQTLKAVTPLIKEGDFSAKGDNACKDVVSRIIELHLDRIGDPNKRGTVYKLKQV